MDIFDIRRRRLRQLLAEHGGPTPLAKKLGMFGSSYLTQLAGPHPTREVSERLARKLERALALPDGWMDAPASVSTPAAPAPPPAVQTLLAEVVSQAEAARQTLSATPSPAAYGQAVALAYEVAQAAGRADPELTRRLLALVLAPRS